MYYFQLHYLYQDTIFFKLSSCLQDFTDQRNLPDFALSCEGEKTHKKNCRKPFRMQQFTMERKVVAGHRFELWTCGL